MKVGIIGAGGIAQKMAATMQQMSEVEAYAVASRNGERARLFAKEYGIKHAYGSHEEMVSDPEVDLVYVATPHAFHFEHIMLSLDHGKPVLCEKAFTSNASEARAVFEMAKEKNLLVTEALWTRYMPSREMINQLLNEGVIGNPTSLTANLGYVINHVNRLTDPALAGGALLDLSVYPINFAMMVFGEDYSSVKGEAILTDTGVDAMNSITMHWPDGRMAVLHSNMMAITDRRGVVFGDKGYLEVKNINNCEEISVYNLDRQLVGHYSVPEQISGYEYQLLACKRALDEGEIECYEMPHASSLKVLDILDALRKKWSVKFPWE